MCDVVDFAKKLGVKNIVTRMGFIPENPNDLTFAPFCDAIREVAVHLKKNGKNLLFEIGQETPVTMLRCFETIGTDNLGANLDTANLILYGKAIPVDALDVFRDKVMNIQAKDGRCPINGHEFGEGVRMGSGKVVFEKIFQKLYELYYDSYITIEREIEGKQQTENIRFAKRYLEDIIDRTYGGGVC